MFHSQLTAEIVKNLKTSETGGLSENEAQTRLTKFGPNSLPQPPKPSLFLMFVYQFKNVLVLILLSATFISLFLGDILDALAIAAIVLLNAFIGFVQELSAEKTLESLKKEEKQYFLVLRNKTVESINTAEIVPGDILIIEEGNKIPADARILESFSLRIDESILTGESKDVFKTKNLLPEKTVLADRINMVFKETNCIGGRGKAVVVATGSETEIGKIALFLEKEKKGVTPLTRELGKVGGILTLIILFIAVLMLGINIFKNISFVDSLLVSIALAVAAIPEGLPAIVTIVLSLGVKRMSGKKALIKNLAAAETLGAVKIIASDKTGTLTQNKITVVKVFPYFGNLFMPAILANNAHFQTDDIPGQTRILGDTTEGALLLWAKSENQNIDQIKNSQPKIFETPFTSERKMMSVVVKDDHSNDHYLYAKGAPEIIISKSNLSVNEKIKMLRNSQKMASEGLRSLAFGRRKLTLNEVTRMLSENSILENNLEFMGMVGMEDPLRPEVKDALINAKAAGIRTIMITGDHAETAKSIARELGIINSSKKVLTDEEVLNMSQNSLTREIKNGVSVFARISPMGKLKIVKALKRLNIQIAVTGDGVNDAPALKAADIGIAMGKTGTDLTREVADMVITDDNYATIIEAVREGRVIYANLVKFIRYLISCNISEVIVVALSVMTSLPPPLIPIQLLWINLITDGLPALALGIDPPEFDVMKKPPRDTKVGILHKKRLVYIFLEGLVMGITIFFLYLYALSKFPYETAQTLAFSALVLTQLVHAFNNRSTRKSLFRIGLFTNKALVFAAIFSIILQFLIVSSGWGNLIFKTVRLNTSEWLMVANVALIPFIVVEIKKILRFRILP